MAYGWQDKTEKSPRIYEVDQLTVADSRMSRTSKDGSGHLRTSSIRPEPVESSIMDQDLSPPIGRKKKKKISFSPTTETCLTYASNENSCLKKTGKDGTPMSRGAQSGVQDKIVSKSKVELAKALGEEHVQYPQCRQTWYSLKVMCQKVSLQFLYQNCLRNLIPPSAKS